MTADATAELHLSQAIEANNSIWELLERDDLDADDQAILDADFAGAPI